VTGGVRRLGRPAAATALTLALAGCAFGTTAAPSLEPILAGPTPTVTNYDLGTSAWIDGFLVTLLSATASLDSKGGTLKVLVRLENTGEDDATLDAPIVLTAGDTTFQLTHGTELPDQPGGAVATMDLSFDVVGRGNVDDGVIRIGRDGEHTVAIPLRPSTGRAVTLEPVNLDVTGKGSSPTVSVVLHHVEVRWDLPDWHDELPSDRQAVTITYDVTYLGSFRGGFALTADNVHLRLPDGKTDVAPRADGHSQSIALISAGKTEKGVTSRFEIADGLTGRFWLVIGDGSTKRAIPFTLGP
jgi:hypothetical protein